MLPFAAIAALALLASSVRASVYVTDPVASTTCTGGSPCSVSWIDNGEAPLLSDIGECNVGLYTGELVLVQSLPSVNVATTSSFSFTPDPTAGPDGSYYIVFTATSISYQGFSATFTIDGMTGTTPSGGSSAPVSVPATTSSGSSVSAGSSAPGGASGTGTNTASTPAGTSTGTIAPTTAPGVGTTGNPTSTIPSTTTTSKASTSTTPASNAAGRVGSSFGGLAALFVLSGALAF